MALSTKFPLPYAITNRLLMMFHCFIWFRVLNEFVFRFMVVCMFFIFYFNYVISFLLLFISYICIGLGFFYIVILFLNVCTKFLKT